MKYGKLIFLLLIVLAGFNNPVLSQLPSGNYIIVNLGNNLAWDLDTACTKQSRECFTKLAVKSGKSSQVWKITENNGFISIGNVSLDRIISANEKLVQLNNYFPTFTNNFKAVKNTDGSFTLVQAIFEANEQLTTASATLQPLGNNMIHLGSRDAVATKLQSWLFIQVNDKKESAASLNPSTDHNGLAKNQNDPHQKVKALIQQSNELKQKKDFDKAIEILQTAIEQEPDNDEAIVELAGAYWSKKDWNHVVQFAEKAKTINPKNSNAWNLLGLIAKDNKDCETAIVYFKKVTELNELANNAWANMGWCYDNIGKRMEAIDAYTKAINIIEQNNFGKQPYIYNNRGVSLVGLGRFDDAIADYYRCLSLDPGYTLARNNLDWAYKNYPASYYNLQKSPSSVKELITAYQAAYAKGNYTESVGVSNQIIALDPNNSIHYYNRALAYKMMENFVAAQSDVERSLKMDPDDPDAWIIQGYIFSDQKKKSEAVSAYSKAIQLGTNNYTAYLNRGTIYMNDRRFEESLADYKKALTIAPTVAITHNNVASAYLMLNKMNQGLAELRKALRIEPNHALALQNMKAFFPSLPLSFNDYDSDALYFATENNDAEKVAIRLKVYKPDVNLGRKTAYFEKVTPLHVAAANENPVILESLLNFGADPNAQNSRGATPMMNVFINAYKEGSPVDRMVQLLLDNGADPNIKDIDGETALNSAAKSLRAYTAIPRLLQAGANPNNADKNGETPLMSCEQRATPFYVKKLIEGGANIHLKNKEGRTALDFAASAFSLGNIYYLFKAGANTQSITDPSVMLFIKFLQLAPGNSPEAKLIDAVVANNLSAVQNTLSSKDNFDSVFLTYMLVAAIDNNTPAMLQALVSKGANARATLRNTSLAVIAERRLANNAASYLKTIPGVGTGQRFGQEPDRRTRFFIELNPLVDEIIAAGNGTPFNACSQVSLLRERVLRVRNMADVTDKEQDTAIKNLVTIYNLLGVKFKCASFQKLNL